MFLKNVGKHIHAAQCHNPEDKSPHFYLYENLIAYFEVLSWHENPQLWSSYQPGFKSDMP